MADLLSVGSERVEVCVNGPAWSLTIEYGVMRAWYIGCALGLQPREEISIISVRSKVFAGVAHWLGTGSPVRQTEFDSPRSLHLQECGQVNRDHAGLISHASGVRLASPQPFFRQASFLPDRRRSIPKTLEVNIEFGNTQRERTEVLLPFTQGIPLRRRGTSWRVHPCVCFWGRFDPRPRARFPCLD